MGRLKSEPYCLAQSQPLFIEVSRSPPLQKKVTFMKLVGQIHLATANSSKSFAESRTSRIGCGRPPLLTPKMASYWLGLVTSVPTSIGKALLAGLEHDYIADSKAIEERFPQTLISYEQAVTDTIQDEGTFVRSNVWGGFEPAALRRWQPGYGYYPKQAGASIKTQASAAALWKVAQKIGSREKGYYFANILWRTREWLDIFFGGGKPIRVSPPGPDLKVGDFIDSWKVIRCDNNQFLSLFFGMKGPGLGRLEITIKDLGDERELDITAWWHPQGFLGLLYWFAMMPAHLFIFKGMVKAIAKEANRLENKKPPQ